jgi:hypothetical protein
MKVIFVLKGDNLALSQTISKHSPAHSYPVLSYTNRSTLQNTNGSPFPSFLIAEKTESLRDGLDRPPRAHPTISLGPAKPKSPPLCHGRSLVNPAPGCSAAYTALSIPPRHLYRHVGLPANLSVSAASDTRAQARASSKKPPPPQLVCPSLHFAEEEKGDQKTEKGIGGTDQRWKLPALAQQWRVGASRRWRCYSAPRWRRWPSTCCSARCRSGPPS